MVLHQDSNRSRHSSVIQEGLHFSRYQQLLLTVQPPLRARCLQRHGTEGLTLIVHSIIGFSRLWRFATAVVIYEVMTKTKHNTDAGLWLAIPFLCGSRSSVLSRSFVWNDMWRKKQNFLAGRDSSGASTSTPNQNMVWLLIIIHHNGEWQSGIECA